MSEKHQKVRVHIDRKKYEIDSPTTNLELYRVASIPAGYELFREVQGNKEDEAVPNNQQEIHLKEDEHFYSAQVTLNPGA